MNRLYAISRRESGNENQYLKTLPAGGGWRKKRPDENEIKIRYAGRNGGAQGRGLNSPKNAFEEHQDAIGIEKLRNFFFFAAGMNRGWRLQDRTCSRNNRGIEAGASFNH
ncbi:hypothetical protein TNCV_252461 [Trichonephila clavipes]|nr:hypothetical protein TNCV_252461 [Trichonephila clavipes]